MIYYVLLKSKSQSANLMFVHVCSSSPCRSDFHLDRVAWIAYDCLSFMWWSKVNFDAFCSPF